MEPDELPPRVIARLRATQRPTNEPAVPGELDAAILASARIMIARDRLKRRLYRAVAATSAVAAVLIVVLWKGGLLRSESPALQISAVRNDVNGDGRVDILDAFYLARRVSDRKPEMSWDVNNDGKVDHADVDAIATLAVRVGGGES